MLPNHDGAVAIKELTSARTSIAEACVVGVSPAVLAANMVGERDSVSLSALDGAVVLLVIATLSFGDAGRASASRLWGD